MTEEINKNSSEEVFEDFPDKKIEVPAENNETNKSEIKNSEEKISSNMDNSPNSPSKKVLKSFNKRIFLFGGLFLLIVIFIVSYALFMDFSSYLSEESFLRGGLVELEEGKQINFNIDEEKHSLEVEQVFENSVSLIIRSEIIEVNLSVGETKAFDLDGDEELDIELRLEKIVEGVPELFIKRIIGVTCVESWACEDWGNCVGGSQSRVCLDLNECETDVNRPEEVMSCSTGNLTNNETNVTLLNCSELSGDICNSSEICNGSYLNVSDSNYCCSVTCFLEAVNTSVNETCEDLGLYDYPQDVGDGWCLFPGEGTYYYEGTEDFFACCNLPLIYPIRLSEELRIVWNAIENSGNCTDYFSNLESCSPYKCNYTENFSQEESYVKGIVGDYDGKCHGFDELLWDQELYCQYNNTQIVDMIDYGLFYEEQCIENDCTIVDNETGYFINDILTRDILEEMYHGRDCFSDSLPFFYD